MRKLNRGLYILGKFLKKGNEICLYRNDRKTFARFYKKITIGTEMCL